MTVNQYYKKLKHFNYMKKNILSIHNYQKIDPISYDGRQFECGHIVEKTTMLCA